MGSTLSVAGAGSWGPVVPLPRSLDADGPEGVLDQDAAFQGASPSLQADYDRFAAADLSADRPLTNELMDRAVRRYQRELTPLMIREAGSEPKVKMQSARWFPDDDDFDRIEEIRLKMSLPADGMEP